MTTATYPQQITEITTVEMTYDSLMNEDKVTAKTSGRWTIIPLTHLLKGDPETNIFETALVQHYPYSDIGYRMIDVVNGVVHYEVTRAGWLGVDGQYH